MTPTAAGQQHRAKSQTNVGYDVGVDWTPVRGVMLSVTGFYEFFENELVSQSPARGCQLLVQRAGLRTPRRRIRRRVVPSRGLRLTASYLHNDQIYTDYSAERLSGAALKPSSIAPATRSPASRRTRSRRG